jgi:hypothetical protein
MKLKRKKLGKLMPLLEAALLEMTDERGTVRVDDAGLLAYQKDNKLYIEWADGFTICKPVAEIRPKVG